MCWKGWRKRVIEMEYVKRRWLSGNGCTEDLHLAEWMWRRPKYQRLVFENKRNGEVEFPSLLLFPTDLYADHTLARCLHAVTGWRSWRWIDPRYWGRKIPPWQSGDQTIRSW